MEEKKQIKINLKTVIILFIILLGLLIGIYFLIVNLTNKKYINYGAIKIENSEISDETIIQLLDVDAKDFTNFKDNFIGANVIIEDKPEQTKRSTFIIESDTEISNSKKIELKNQAQENFKLLETYILNCDKDIAQKLLEGLKNPNLYTYTNKKLTLIENSDDINISSETLNKFYAYVCSGLIKNHFNFEEYSINILNIEKNNDIDIYMTINNKYFITFEYGESECYFSFYKGTEYNINKKYLVFDHIGGYNSLKSWYRIGTMTSIAKPIIYLYPTEDTEISVKLLKDEDLTCSYPKYKDKWKVLAQPNGNLKDLDTNRQLYSLYYESKSNSEFKVESEGFVIKGVDTIKFLEEKLAILGLTERETEEFIIYWLPKLEANKYNYIRFATTDEINKNMPLEINPSPDTIIRVLMIFKGLDNPIEVQEQQLTTPERKGFVAVEWGGTEIK